MTINLDNYWNIDPEIIKKRQLENEIIRKSDQVQMVKWVAFTTQATTEQINNFLSTIWK